MSNVINWKAKSYTPDYSASKKKIIEAAIELVEEKGISKFRFAELAEKVGCVRTTIYRYFDSKDQLLTDMMTALMFEMAADILANTDSSESATDRFATSIHRVITKLTNEPRYRVMIDPGNNKYFTALAVETIPEKMSPLLHEYLLNDEEFDIQNKGISAEDVSRWLIIQVMALTLFGPIGKTEEEQKLFIRKMVVAPLL